MVFKFKTFFLNRKINISLFLVASMRTLTTLKTLFRFTGAFQNIFLHAIGGYVKARTIFLQGVSVKMISINKFVF